MLFVSLTDTHTTFIWHGTHYLFSKEKHRCLRKMKMNDAAGGSSVVRCRCRGRGPSVPPLFQLCGGSIHSGIENIPAVSHTATIHTSTACKISKSSGMDSDILFLGCVCVSVCRE
mmetsp:Transcript_15628/g.17214  ORF Transcript_15628/g.17214 Transcript_15628/m.17214 type:complete len:115 (+) Transcript_15628:117-461(+)